MPGCPPVVGIEQLRIGFDRPAVAEPLVVGRNDEAPLVRRAALHDRVTRSGGVPGPAGQLDRLGDFAGRAPAPAVVRRPQHEDPARVARGVAFDRALAVAPGVPGRQQHDLAPASRHDGRRIAAGVGAVVPDDRRGTPRAAAVRRPAHDQVDVSRIVLVVAARLGEGQQRPVGRTDDGRNPVSGIAGIALDEEVDRPVRIVLRRARHRQHRGAEGCDAPDDTGYGSFHNVFGICG